MSVNTFTQSKLRDEVEKVSRKNNKLRERERDILEEKRRSEEKVGNKKSSVVRPKNL